MKSADIKKLVLDAGAVATGIAKARQVTPEAEELYQTWIADGRHGGMEYMERYADVRRDPRMLLDGAESVIVAAFNYYTPKNHGDSMDGSSAPLKWARYALGRDYHEEIRDRLSAVAGEITALTGAQCRVTVDTAPLRERYWAVEAGIGFIGVNNQLIIPGTGSWVLLGEIITTLPLEADEPCRLSCDGCMKCVKACPGRALDGHGGMDAGRCMSYLTIEYRGEGPIGCGDRIYGCDICQEVCPHNSCARPSEIPAFAPRESILSLTRDDILTMEQGEFSRIFTHSAIKRTKLAGLQRNAGG
ncbi:MAG: tRNA epoxyqueuosine(34) reductase QueG [Paenibacillus sp.]|nr:tRNA epoxyqueuosine(34) reductase QueG [Paenibacillus sp.]